MGFIIEENDDGDVMLTITAVEGFSAILHPNGNIVLIGQKDAFRGIEELLRDEMDEET